MAPQDPASQQHLSSSPPTGVVGGNLRCCCSAGFACGELSCLLETLLQVFFPPLFSSRLFFFFPSQVFTGLPRRPNIPPTLPPLLSPPPRAPRPRRSPRGTSNHPCAASEASATATQLSTPNSIGCVKNGLRLFSRRAKTLAWCYFVQTRICNLAQPLHEPDFPRTIPLFLIHFL